jgi:hypothetical protein
MFKDARAKRAWLLYFLRAEAVLSPLAPAVRRELIDDLKTHVRDILANEPATGDELSRLNAAFDRIGNPKEYLAPLLADAVFRTPPRFSSVGMTARTLLLYAASGAGYAVQTLWLTLTGMLGFCLALASLNSLARPDRAGLFLIAPDEYQLRLLGIGQTAGQQLLEPWLAILLIIAGAALVTIAARGARRVLFKLIAQTA